jgi:hypothetical protein
MKLMCGSPKHSLSMLGIVTLKSFIFILNQLPMDIMGRCTSHTLDTSMTNLVRYECMLES